MSGPVNYQSVMTLISPVAHTEVSLGTDAKFRRLRFLVDGRPIDIPVISGNSIRGLLRRAAARTVLEVLGVTREALNVDAFDLLFAGGALEKGAGIAYPIDELRQARNALPPLATFGGSTHGHILAGQVDVDMAIPIARETELWTGIQADESLWDMMQEIPYAHRDDRDDREERSRTQMRYTVECLIPGVRLAHGATLRSDSIHVAGCFWDAVERVAAENRIGGKGATGHGRFEWTWRAPDGLVEAYREHLSGIADQAASFLGLDRLPA
jgi:hypothetical protein